MRDFTNADFVARRHNENHEYQPELVIQRVNAKNEIMFGTLFNYVQYFAEVGGFDALLNLFRMGGKASAASVMAEEASSAAAGKEGAGQIDTSAAGSTTMLPFRLITLLLHSFTHLRDVLN